MEIKPECRWGIAFLALLLACVGAPDSCAQESWVKETSFAGLFYPKDKNELDRLLDYYYRGKDSSAVISQGELIGLVVPHAGYVYSGAIAADAYREIKPGDFDTVILLGPFHKALIQASIWKEGVWKTPLGETAVDAPLAEAILAEDSSFSAIPYIHRLEHSLEVQLPFLQKRLGEFKIVPILVSDASKANTEKLARAILKHTANRKALYVASTDMSHYRSDSETKLMDKGTLDLIVGGEPGSLHQSLSANKSELCGEAAVLTLMRIAEAKGATFQLIRYGTSADSNGDPSRVVGYGALAMRRAVLSEEDKRTLLNAARKTLVQFVETGKAPVSRSDSAVLNAPGACFVTLRKDGELRGCIGNLEAKEPLMEAVQAMTIQAASRDPRFKPVRSEELPAIRIGISYLSKPRAVPDASAVEIGKHGVILSRGLKRGVFLPQVAGETGWTKEEFMTALCVEKTRLEPDCWKSPDTRIEVFEAIEFED